MTFLMNLLWLIFAHFVGDWGLQSNWMAQKKKESFIVMVAHCIIWTGCICIALEYLNLFSLWKIGFLFFFHFISDEVKSSFSGFDEENEENWWMIYPDQAWHIFQCVIVALF